MSQPFTPETTSSLSVTTSNTQGTLTSSASQRVRIYNAGPNAAHFRAGVGAQTAVTTDMPLAPGAIEMFTLPYATHVAAICATGTATVYITTGNGE